MHKYAQFNLTLFSHLLKKKKICRRV